MGRINKIVFVGGVFLFVWLIPVVFGLSFNFFSNSMPRGIYKKVKGNDYNKGDYVTTCLYDQAAQVALVNKYTPKGTCPTGIMPLMKKIFALPGDVIEIKDRYLVINKNVTSFKILEHDSKGKKLDLMYTTPLILKDGEYFILSDFRSNSWDSRYFGPVNIINKFKPIYIL